MPGEQTCTPILQVERKRCTVSVNIAAQWGIELATHGAGEPVEIKKAVCLHEEDAGILWKHTELRSMHPEVRRGRRLVVSFVCTVANYEYGFYWYFGQVRVQALALL